MSKKMFLPRSLKKFGGRMTQVKKISIITPCYNADCYIEETIQSALTNSLVKKRLIELEYIVADGGSTDNTLQIVKNTFARHENENIKTIIISENDHGLYDALSKGLKLVSGDIVSYLNAGDYYSPFCFEIITEIFNNYKIKWLTGMDAVYNEKSHLIYSALPFRYRKNLIQCGFYDFHMLPHIQQESTFWDISLNELIHYEQLKKYRYAGDYYLWKQFSRLEDLYIVEAWLGGFKVHKGQLSSNIDKYHEEMRSIAERRPKIIDYIQAYYDKLIWSLPNRSKIFFNRKSLFSFNHESQKYELS
jgi:glycosyltransferase involved in cell wall biosynthesis